MQRIAVVEDNPVNRLLVEAILSAHFELIEFEDGPSALAGMKAARPDVILLDVSLPCMDGVEVLARLRCDSETASLPAIALTAHAMAGDRHRLLGLGFDDYVSKPITDEGLLFAAIRGCLERSAAARRADAPCR